MKTAMKIPPGWKSEPQPVAVLVRHTEAGGKVEIIQWDRKSYVVEAHSAYGGKVVHLGSYGELDTACRVANARAALVERGWVDAAAMAAEVA